MELAVRTIELFAFITGIIYIILEIRQKNMMWVIGILTGLACSFSYAVQHLYASMGLNIYYVFVSIWGLVQWRRDKGALAGEGESVIHLNRLSLKTALVSLAIFLLGSACLVFILRLAGGSETSFDAVVAVMSAIGTWWLARSYPQQWLVWIVADLLSTVLCLKTGMYWMAVLYLAYTASAVFGYYHWMRKGKVIC